MKRKVLALTLVLLLVFLTGCGMKNEGVRQVQDSLASVATTESAAPPMFGNTGSGTMNKVSAPIEPKAKNDGATNVREQKLIKTGDITVEVKDMQKNYDKVLELVKQYQGFVFGMRESNYTDESNMYLTIKVPAENFEKLFAELKKIGVAKSSNIQTEDVTRQFIDTQARIETLKLQETTLKGIMAQATKIDDLLRLETELQRVREDIESSQGNLNYLTNATSLSVIEFRMTTERVPSTIPGEENIFEKLWFSIKDGLGFWGNALLGLISLILWLLPVIVVGVLVFGPVRKLIKKLRARWLTRAPKR